MSCSLDSGARMKDYSAAYQGAQHSAHRKPYSAGGADRYYGRQFSPNFTCNGVKITKDEMTAEQIAEYTQGWDDELDKKDWG